MKSVRRSVVLAQVAEVLELDVGELHDASSPDTVESWDSERMIEILMSVEELTDIQFSASEISQIRSLGDLLGLLQKREALAS